jgi:signal transduction histidine kinase
MSARVVRHGVAAYAVLGTVLLGIVALNSSRWIDAVFPGFFVMANRVVPSIALRDWGAGNPWRLFQHQIIAVDGAPVDSADAVYARVATRPAGSPVTYTVRSAEGRIFTADVPSRRFSPEDYALIFGAYLLNGVAFLVAGLLVAYLKPTDAASRGLLSLGVTTGSFVVTAVDLYAPHWFFRVHVIAEAFLGASFIHLALVFPMDRIRKHRGLALATLYIPVAVLACVYEAVLASPSAYTRVHLFATATHGVGALCLIVAVVHDLVRTRSPLVRRRISVVALSVCAAFVVPSVLWAWSVVGGGGVPLNTAAFTAFLFPLGLAYAIVKQDLFEIDVMLRRATTYVLTVVAIAAVYLSGLSVVGIVVQSERIAQSPVALAAFNLVILFVMAPVKARIQHAVDRVFFRRSYDAEASLADLSQTLASAHTLSDVLGHTRQLLSDTVCPASVAIFLRTPNGVLVRAAGGSGPADLPDGVVARLARDGIIARYEWDDGSGRHVPPFWHDFGAELVVAVRSGADVIGALILGPTLSRRAYAAHDTAFLRAVTSQVALALLNAEAFDKLETLNASLEAQVRERTSALEIANRDLNRSFGDLNAAYQQLEQSQTSLIRADRLATLGRLIGGIAHEVNTPLGAVLNSLKLLEDLSREYDTSIDDPKVTAEDHHAIARELATTALSATRWARRAASFISKVKMHGRDPRERGAQPFTIEAAANETQALLAHRLRATSCQVRFEASPRDVTVHGDSTGFGQVLVNLVTNAIDAYEDQRIDDGVIEIRAEETAEAVIIQVRDRAGGMPTAVAARIFDELYTTKEAGRGTGLGLWIARNLVEERFGGTLSVETELGVGSCFTIRLPRNMRPADAASLAVPVE